MGRSNHHQDGSSQPHDTTLRIGAIDRIENDRMNMAATAIALAELIATVDPPFTIAIRGDWGTGKSSVLNMTRSLFDPATAPAKSNEKKRPESTGDDAPNHQQSIVDAFRNKWVGKVAVAQFNPWADSELVRSSRASTLLIERFIRTLRQNKFISKTLAKSILIKMGRPTARFAAGSLMSFIGRSTRPFDNEIDMSSMSARLDEAIYADSLREDLTAALHSKKPDDRRIVFFIDDLDRIDPVNAVRILDTITGLLNMPRCIFVIAIDQDVLMQGVKKRFEDETFARNYFDKTFNLSLKLSHTLSPREIKGLFKDRLKLGEKHKSVPLPVQPIIEQCAFGNPRSLKKLMWLAHFRSEEMRNSLTREGSDTEDVPEAAVASALAAVENAYPEFHRQVYSRDISDMGHWDFLERALNSTRKDSDDNSDEKLTDKDKEPLKQKRAAIDKSLEYPESIHSKPSKEAMRDAALVIKAQFHAIISQLVDRSREEHEASREETSNDQVFSPIDESLPTSDAVYQNRRRSGWMATYVSSQLVSQRKHFGFQYSYPQSIYRYMARNWSFSSVYIEDYAGYLSDRILGYVSHIGANGFDLWVDAKDLDPLTVISLQEDLNGLTANQDGADDVVQFSKQRFPVGTKGQHRTHSVFEAAPPDNYVYLGGWTIKPSLDTYDDFEQKYDLVSDILIGAIARVSEVLDDRRE